MPVISALTFFTTESTIVATWTTDVSADSNLTASGKAAIDNGVAANSTSHQAIVAGLLSNTTYSCVVTSGGTSSAQQNVTTSPARNRVVIKSATMGAASIAAFAPPGGGDSQTDFVSSDNVTYISENDTFGFSGINNAGGNSQFGKLTNESTFAGADVNLLTSYGTGGIDQRDGTDGPSGTPLRAAVNGMFGMNNHLFLFMDRNNQSTSPPVIWYGNVIRDNADHGATWNRFDIPSSFAANGQGPADGIFEFAQSTYGATGPVLYAADDGTLGYTTSGNGIDGANAYVYVTFVNNTGLGSSVYMLRWPRIRFDACSQTGIQYWIGPSSPAPTDFVNDSNWSASDASKTAIFATPANQFGSRVAFVPVINRYMLIQGIATSNSNTDFKFYEGPTPAGPWTLFFSQNNNPNGWVAPYFMHRDLFANSSTDTIALRMLYSGDFTNPTAYKCHFSTLTLRTTTMPSNTRVQANANTVGGYGVTATQFALAYTSNVTLGNLLIAATRAANSVTFNSIVFTIGGVDFTGTNVFYTQQAASGIWLAWGYIFAPASGVCTAKFNWSANNTGNGMVLAEYNGCNTVRAVDSVGATGTNNTPLSNAIATSAGDLLVGPLSVNSSTSMVAGSGYTVASKTDVAGTSFFCGVEDNLNGAGGSLTAGWTTVGTSNWIAGIGAFFAGNFSIAGSAGVAGATVAYTGPLSGSVVADGSGNFSIPNLNLNGTYTITPSLTGKIFSPSSRIVNLVSANVTGVNFTANNAGNPGTITITMLDATTIVLSIPGSQSATQFVQHLRRQGGVWSVPPDPAVPATWYPYKYWQKLATS